LIGFWNKVKSVATSAKCMTGHYASERLQDNANIVKKFAKINGGSIFWVIPRLRNDKDIMQIAIHSIKEILISHGVDKEKVRKFIY
jgi:hypothetical protein